MAGSTPHEAVTNFVEPLRESLKCVTNGVFNAQRPKPNLAGPWKANLNGGTPAPLGNSDYSLFVAMTYDTVAAEGDRGPWKVRTLEYIYKVLRDRQEIAGWHWHPITTPERTMPHMHSYGADGKLHLPTGRVALEHVLMFTMTDLEVEPLRSDAFDVIDGVLKRFERYRTWA